MIPEEILRKIHLIHIRTKHLVNDIMAGEYESAFRGRGMEFEEVREYQPGDDVRAIDWNVTARMGKPYIKLFREERELIVMLLVDISASGLLFANSSEALEKSLMLYSDIDVQLRFGPRSISSPAISAPRIL